MNSDRRMPSGWTFAAGVLIGGLGVFASLGMPGVKGESRAQKPVAVEGASAAAPQVVPASDSGRTDTARHETRSPSPAAQPETNSPPQLDQQLD